MRQRDGWMGRRNIGSGFKRLLAGVLNAVDKTGELVKIQGLFYGTPIFFPNNDKIFAVFSGYFQNLMAGDGLVNMRF